jgi:hypothetical protein
MISYGTINFEELEMKKYTGNVSFILNINEVDVTPSRENVIWNTKTREAVKKMFISAQKTVTDLIEDKIKDETNLPDYLTLLANFKDKNTISGINELYKIIDVSQIDNNFRNFKIGTAAVQMSELATRKDFICTSTENTNQYGNRRIADTNYNSSLSKDYVAKLSAKNKLSNLVVYIGDPKLNGIARYVADKFQIDDRHIDIIYIKEDVYKMHADLVLEKGLEEYLDEMYTAEDFRSVLIAEVVRFATTPGTMHRVLLHEDIDLTEMANLAKVQEEAKSNAYLSWAEQQKASGKAIGNYHYTPMSTSRNYYDESIATEEKIIIYQQGNAFCEKLFKQAENTIPTGYKIVGFSQENFKRFYKVPGVRNLTDCLYTIEFGDLQFTTLGKVFIPHTIRTEIDKLYTKNKHKRNIQGTSLEFLDDCFKDFKIDNTIFERIIRDKVVSIKGKRSRYLKAAKECTCKECETL